MIPISPAYGVNPPHWIDWSQPATLSIAPLTQPDPPQWLDNSRPGPGLVERRAAVDATVGVERAVTAGGTARDAGGSKVADRADHDVLEGSSAVAHAGRGASASPAELPAVGAPRPPLGPAPVSFPVAIRSDPPEDADHLAEHLDIGGDDRLVSRVLGL